MSGPDGMRLTDEAQEDRNDFEAKYGDHGNCSCHLSPPCSSCLHPGNPNNQDEDDSCWQPDVGPTDEERKNDVAAYVKCDGGLVEGDPGCGLQPLTSAQYTQQLSLPDRGWRCPKCGNSAKYDDTESERVQGVNDDAGESLDEILASIPEPVLDEIGIERERQKIVEGYTDAHDDEHTGGELVRAAIAYLLVQRMPRVYGTAADWWPFDDASFKPKGPRRTDLIRAGALIVAEIERLDRSASRQVADTGSPS